MKLVIELDDRGQLHLHGPIHDKVLCYGLLESAKDVVRDFVQKQAESKIIKAAPTDIFSKNGH